MAGKLHKYQGPLNTIDVIKIIGVIFMIVDHVGEYLVNDDTLWRLFGRLAAPLFFFAVGYNTAKSKHLSIPLYLVLLGLILSLTDYLIEKEFQLNILVNIFIIKMCLQYYPPKTWSNKKFLLLTFVIVTLNCYVRNYVEYGLIGFIYAYGAYALFLGKRKLAVTLFFLAVFAQFGYYWEQFQEHYVLLALIGAVIWLALSCFQMREINVQGYLKKCLSFCSRYTLEIYFVHLFLLRVYVLIR